MEESLFGPMIQEGASKVASVSQSGKLRDQISNSRQKAESKLEVGLG